MTILQRRVFAPSNTKRYCEDCANFIWDKDATDPTDRGDECGLLRMHVTMKSRICAYFKLASFLTPTHEEERLRTEGPPHLWPRWSGSAHEDDLPLLSYEGSADFASLKITERTDIKAPKRLFHDRPNAFICPGTCKDGCCGDCKCPKCGDAVCFCELP